MRRTPIRVKLGVALAVPLLGLFLITVIEVAGTAGDVAEVRRQTALARASIGPSGLITSLQNERTWAVTELIGQETAIQPPIVGYDESRAVTDQAISAFRDTLGDASGETAAAYEPALTSLAGLNDLRARIDESTGPRDLTNVEFSDEIYTGYAEMIEPFLDANTQVALAVDDAQLRQATSLVDTTTRQIENVADLARITIMEVGLGGGLDRADEIAVVARLRAAFDAANAELLDARAPFDQVVADAYPEEFAAGLSGHVDAALAGETVDPLAVMATLDVPAEGGYIGVRDVLVRGLNDRADSLNAEAESRQRLYVTLAVATLAVAIGLSWLVTRSITRPLRSLTRQAKEMADRRLPHAVVDILDTPLGEDIAVPTVEPVRVTARDEVADVADALNTVQDTALDLAVEQAVLRRNIADSFVNLGRRNQNLLGRQLDFITELETNETDADALANLFRLDHLATRMRRNAESLLVLAGIEPPRQWAAPVRLSDVIRAALGEVEDYQRVTVRGVEPATVIGSAAADLAHLLAELIENALAFSPPDQTVDIRGRNRPDGAYTLAIIDSGLGMPTSDVTNANRRLAGAESFTIAPSKYLGHYVAGNLAARHGIGVHLDNSPSNGITATVSVPASMLTDEQVTGAPVTPPHGHQLGPARLPAGRAGPASPPAVPAPGTNGHRAAGPPLAPAPGRTASPVPPGQPTDTWGIPSGRPADPWAPPTAPPLHPATSPVPPTVDPPVEPQPSPSLWPRTTRLGGGPRPRAEFSAGGSGAAGTTAGGLARRSPTTQSPGGPPPVDDDLLAAIGRVTTGRTTGRGHQAPPGRAQPDPQPGGLRPDRPRSPAPISAPDGLDRRVRGAQMPRAAVVPLRQNGAAGTPRPGPTPAAGASKATDVQTLLRSFTAGVQRGLDEATRQAPSDGGGPAGDTTW
jgi:signal transduction histidine kinase